LWDIEKLDRISDILSHRGASGCDFAHFFLLSHPGSSLPWLYAMSEPATWAFTVSGIENQDGQISILKLGKSGEVGR
jgi:hypothetical protein